MPNVPKAATPYVYVNILVTNVIAGRQFFLVGNARANVVSKACIARLASIDHFIERSDDATRMHALLAWRSLALHGSLVSSGVQWDVNQY